MSLTTCSVLFYHVRCIKMGVFQIIKTIFVKGNVKQNPAHRPTTVYATDKPELLVTSVKQSPAFNVTISQSQMFILTVLLN